MQCQSMHHQSALLRASTITYCTANLHKCQQICKTLVCKLYSPFLFSDGDSKRIFTASGVVATLPVYLLTDELLIPPNLSVYFKCGKPFLIVESLSLLTLSVVISTTILARGVEGASLPMSDTASFTTHSRRTWEKQLKCCNSLPPPSSRNHYQRGLG